MKFEWDDRKAAANLAKHGVSFHKALYRDDPAHSKTEPRLHVMGRVGRWILAVSYTVRGEGVRLISARFASRQERRLYAAAQR
ncbi:MAG: hypothetical protein A2992_00235 [Elusimicrobia bacterium RIFCSPLOWO2_01_FULL_59_12]|nr:MAG: hypothetical protein A2992_00235 [Elusimicrobia bacterium RIFCSPLOWO2_01_FULL_59_12]